jgi:hypothetical protein
MSTKRVTTNRYDYVMHGLRFLAVGAVLMMGTAGCGGMSRPSSRVPATTKTSLTTMPSSSPTLTPLSSSSAPFTSTYRDNGRTVSIRRGDRLTVRLGSTYWTINGSSDPNVVQQQGDATKSPAPGCVPGGGCGTTAASFVALAPGQAEITATRLICGEALRCSTSAGFYQLNVKVENG